MRTDDGVSSDDGGYKNISGFQTIPPSENEKVDIINYRFDTQTVIDEIEHYLRAEFFNSLTKKYERLKNVKPKMNETGISALLIQIQAKVNSVVFQSNLSDEEISRIAKENRKMIVTQLYFNNYEWDVDLESMFSGEIVYLLDHLTFLALKRAWKDKEREHLTPVFHYNEVRHTGQANGQKFKLFGGV